MFYSNMAYIFRFCGWFYVLFLIFVMHVCVFFSSSFPLITPRSCLYKTKKVPVSQVIEADGL